MRGEHLTVKMTDGTESRDHPRMRGEHLEQIDFERLVRGSSPHARGAPM